MFYFIGILSGVGDIFLLDCLQVFFLLNVKFRGIFELYKSPVERGENPLINSIDNHMMEQKKKKLKFDNQMTTLARKERWIFCLWVLSNLTGKVSNA